jgi:hypothetical protein
MEITQKVEKLSVRIQVIFASFTTAFQYKRGIVGEGDARGQGGSGCITIATRPFPVVTLFVAVVALTVSFKFVVCTFWTCCALCADGPFFGWGDSTYGELIWNRHPNQSHVASNFFTHT